MTKGKEGGIWMAMLGDVRFSREKPGEAIYWNLNGKRGCLGDLMLAEKESSLADHVVEMCRVWPNLDDWQQVLHEQLAQEILVASLSASAADEVIVREVVTPTETLPPVATGALVPVNDFKKSPAADDFRLIDLSLIDPSPFQTGLGRGDAEQDPEILSLAASIQEKGLAEPMVVRHKAVGSRFELIAGHRRLAACRMIGRKAEMCIVRWVDDKTAEELHVLENLQRKDLTAIEEAMSVERMLSNGRTPEEVAKATGKSVRWVYRRASITKLTSGWKSAAERWGLSAAYLERVGRLPGPVQEEILKSMTSGVTEDYFARGGDVAVLDEEIEISLRKLSSAPWVHIPGDPAKCGGCVDRSDARPDLFEEMEGEPRCLNRACWEKKVDEFVKAAKAQAKKTHGECIEAKSNSAHLYQAKADGKNSVPVIITDGPKRGTIMWAPSKQEAAAARGEAPKPKSKGEAKKDQAARNYVRAVQACVRGAEQPNWGSAGEEIEIGIIAIVAFALGCGVDTLAVVPGAFANPLLRGLAIKAKIFETRADAVSLLWAGAKGAIARALNPEAADIEKMHKIARDVADALNIPQVMIDGYLTEFSAQ